MRAVFLFFLAGLALWLAGCPAGTLKSLTKSAHSSTQELARQRFLSVENKRKRMPPLRFRGDSVRDKETLNQHKRLLEQLSKDYGKVAAMGAPLWSTAASYRQAELHQNFAKEIRRLSVAEGLSSRNRVGEGAVFLSALQTVVQKHETKAVDRYQLLLQRAKRLNIENRWTCLARKRILEKKEPSKATALSCP